MATSEFRHSFLPSSSFEWLKSKPTGSSHNERSSVKLWMVLDAATVVLAATLATLYEMHTGPVAGALGFWHGTLIHGRSMGILFALFCAFTISLMVTSRRLHLYSPRRLTSFLHE